MDPVGREAWGNLLPQSFSTQLGGGNGSHPRLNLRFLTCKMKIIHLLYRVVEI